jgi:hypothetical protein
VTSIESTNDVAPSRTVNEVFIFVFALTIDRGARLDSHDATSNDNDRKATGGCADRVHDDELRAARTRARNVA